MHYGLGTEIVLDADQQVGLLVHQREIAYRSASGAGQRRRPDQAGCTIAEQIESLNRGDIVNERKLRQSGSIAPAIAALIEIDLRAVRPEIKNVGGSRSVGVGQTDAPLVEFVRRIKPRGVIHRDLRTELTVPRIWPIADFAVADAHQITQPVA